MGSKFASLQHVRYSAQESWHQSQKDSAIDSRFEGSGRIRTRQDEGHAGGWAAGAGTMEDAGDGSTTWRSLAFSFNRGKGNRLEFQTKYRTTRSGEEANTVQRTLKQTLSFQWPLRISQEIEAVICL